MAEWRVREATAADAGELTRLRAVMFEGLGRDPDSGLPWRDAATASIAERLGGDLVAVLAEAPGPVAVGGAVAIVYDLLPSPSQERPRAAYVLSVATDPAWRRRGIASGCLRLLLDLLEERGVTRYGLNASEGGEGLYRSLGFAPAGNPFLELRR
ncbi:ribosomal protein S18 acetylase RimI-like enzyme [Motilibacter rhizosphaerae]|uniref:Ribosomal protein S18 acetylase RimI-like enzyme n=1 Tax=Motilibacter rhizosphaerae TaxID=598652 RepID=A0A4Q7NZH5_9ACTN|nr:GNAT family N-acetyltransferase [Motilibacter rhizosphaerae]RZS91842.1 ribosomal protein S18 acetylase RimI-like enzyme [Motilibacter rhizosphaerae]